MTLVASSYRTWLTHALVPMVVGGLAAACGGERPDASVSDASARDSGHEDGGAADAGLPDEGIVECFDRAPTSPACGGDLDGRWQVERACASDHPFLATIRQECPAARTRVEAVQASGFIDFVGGGYLRQIDYRFQMEVAQPVQCVALFGGCAAYQAQIVQLGGEAACVETAGTCSCRILSAPFAAIGQGSYSVSGGTFQLVPDAGGAAENWSYCRQVDWTSTYYSDESLGIVWKAVE